MCVGYFYYKKGGVQGMHQTIATGTCEVIQMTPVVMVIQMTPVVMKERTKQLPLHTSRRAYAQKKRGQGHLE